MPARPISLLFAALLAAIPFAGHAQNPDSTAPMPAVQDRLSAPLPAPAPSAAPAPADGKPAERQVEGTKLLFLRLNLRIKLIEQNFVDLTPEQLNQHLVSASSLIDQLRDRPLIDEETARTERAAQYLQNLVDTYVQLHNSRG